SCPRQGTSTETSSEVRGTSLCKLTIVCVVMGLTRACKLSLRRRRCTPQPRVAAAHPGRERCRPWIATLNGLHSPPRVRGRDPGLGNPTLAASQPHADTGP